MIQENISINCTRPSNLNIEVLISNNPPPFSYKKDGFLYLIDLWYSQYGWRKDHKHTIEHEYVRLHSQTLKGVLYDYQKYLNYLVMTGVFLVNSSYQTAKRSKSYRLHDKYQTETVQDSITDVKIINKIDQKKKIDYDLVLNEHEPIIKWFDGLEIDIKGAILYIEEIITIKYKPKMKKAAKQKILLKKACYLQMVNRIYNKDFIFKIDQKSGRLYTVLTNLKKEFRNYLTYKGTKLVCIDLSNSQPFLASVLLQREFYVKNLDSKGKININQLTKYNKAKVFLVLQSILSNLEYYYLSINDNRLGDDEQKIRYKKHYTQLSPSLPMCGKYNWFEERDDSLDEWSLYKTLVKKGEFYKYIGDQISLLSRDQETVLNPKQLVLTVLFAENDDDRIFFKTNQRLFKSIFPSIAGLFEIIKSDDHALLALLLQNIESEIFLKRIAKSITLKEPKVPFFTIHDSICVPDTFENVIKVIVKEVIKKAIGLEPHLKTEHWGANIF